MAAGVITAGEVVQRQHTKHTHTEASTPGKKVWLEFQGGGVGRLGWQQADGWWMKERHVLNR